MDGWKEGTLGKEHLGREHLGGKHTENLSVLLRKYRQHPKMAVMAIAAICSLFSFNRNDSQKSVKTIRNLLEDHPSKADVSIVMLSQLQVSCVRRFKRAFKSRGQFKRAI